MSWEIKEHTKAKHTILKKYLGAWFPIMAFTNQRIVYIDGFAGPGRYLGGEDGSPIYALKIAKEIFETHKDKLKHKEFVFFFIESNQKHYSSLQDEIKKLTLPSNFKVNSHFGTFADTMRVLFDYLDKKNVSLAPTFAFIDPFGTKGVPFEIVKKMMSYPKCEIFFNHMSSGVLRSKHSSDHSELYGTDKWKDFLDTPGGVTNLYANQLRKKAGVSYTRTFNVRNRRNATIFDLIYATNNLTGLARMKEAMWKADPDGNFTFRDKTNPDQIVLFELEPDITPLKKNLLNTFSGQTVTIDEIEEHVLINTPYLVGHIRRKTLTPLLQENKISVKRPKGSKTGFKKGTLITFL